MKLAKLATAVGAMAIVFASPAYADVDTDFANELHGYGIYGPRDKNAWLGKITCQRLYKGVDVNAFESAEFLSHNLGQHITTEQTWQFLGAAVRTYCPDLNHVLTDAAAQHD